MGKSFSLIAFLVHSLFEREGNARATGWFHVADRFLSVLTATGSSSALRAGSFCGRIFADGGRRDVRQGSAVEFGPVLKSFENPRAVQVVAAYREH
ncbi:hypothetical protein M2267_005989 [Ensifer sp. KUDG1]|uniref:hypothetical protein n=1 Tax=Ensifer sp. KUDG1 TaxID=3373919 RepID=UPI003D25D52E